MSRHEGLLAPLVDPDEDRGRGTFRATGAEEKIRAPDLCGGEPPEPVGAGGKSRDAEGEAEAHGRPPAGAATGRSRRHGVDSIARLSSVRGGRRCRASWERLHMRIATLGAGAIGA